MVERKPQTSIITDNERSFRSLGRAIALSSNQFSVVVVCCNYKVLQQQILQRLEEAHDIQKLVLPHNARSLYTTLHTQLSKKQPSALMILGLESVEGLDDLLRAINHIRDEFRKRHSFTMVFWVNDEVQQKFLRLAPDFASWAATPIRFEMTSTQLLQFLQQETDSLFATVLNTRATQRQEREADRHCTVEQVWEHSYELQYAIKELQNHGISLESELNASLEFVFGLDDYVSDRINSAIDHFQESLRCWQELSGNQNELRDKFRIPDLFSSQLDIVNSHASPLLRQGVLLFYMGLCCCRLAERNYAENRRYWHSAKLYFQECLNVLQVSGRPDVAAQFIGDLAEVLQHLQEWQELQMVAQKSLELHQTYGTQIQLACDYGFLAQVAVQEFRWAQASQYARVSLWKLYESKDNSDSNQGIFPLLLAQSYRLILAKAQRNLGEEKIALEQLKMASENLDEALEMSDHRYDAHRYIRLLRSLRSLYFEEGRYLEAFTIRQKRRSVEQQYGFRAFIGAGRLQPQRQATNPALLSPAGGSSVALEIAASGREGDINNLIGRISRSDQKLTVIHGPSGVGKSSTVTAGLVPALQNRAIGDQIAVPVVLQLYDDWVRELGKSLSEAQTQTKKEAVIDDGEVLPFAAAPVTITGIQEQLQENADNHLITVLIFDQFEEFFFGYTDRNKKQEFDIFISQALNIPFVKVILSLREDYLHRLLEFKHLSELEAINKNILDKNIRYPLNNFSPADAKKVMQRLTERSHIYLEPALIDALIEDLSAELGEVRPIELQVAGAQLQDERITSLERYQPYRPNRLIERYIKELIQDCGKENERAALLVLYLLTDENNQRPFKTRAQLAIELEELEDPDKLDLVLEILVRSGLVILFPDVPERYQLIHDYLVDLIRHLQQQESSLQLQLNQLRNKVEQSQIEIERLNSELRQKKQQAKLVGSHFQQGLDLVSELKELRKREEMSRVEIEQLQAELKEKELKTQLAESKEKQKLSEVRVNFYLKFGLAALFIAVLGLIGSLFTIVNSEIKTISASSQALFASDKGIDALKEALSAGRKLQKAVWVDSDTREQVKTALYQAVSEVGERNRLEKHRSGVNSVTYSPDGTIIASASADKTIILWHPDGKIFKTLSGHEDVVNSVSFSPDGSAVSVRGASRREAMPGGLIASSSQDKTVKLWNLNRLQPITLSGHQAGVNSATFSPDGKIIASASNDKTVKLWNRDGKLLRTLLGHEKQVLDVAWSPDGKIIASASADKTIKLWNLEGKLIRTLSGHSDAVKSLAWSPDGKIIASGSLDKDRTIKLWSREGTLLQTLPGHSGGITGISFTHNGKFIASASSDETIKLWTSEGMLLGTLRGHSNWVNSVSFSPDDRIIASASRDKTIKLWNWDNLRQGNPNANNDWITSISFSPDGSLIAGASGDKTVKLWQRDGTLIRSFAGHQGQVWGVSFSPDGKAIASASKDKTVKIWNINGKLINTLKGHSDAVLGVAWSPDGKIIASASKDRTVKLWSPDGKLLKTLTGHENVVNWVSFSPDGQLLASASDDKTVLLWNRDGVLVNTLIGHENVVNWVTFSPDGQLLASASDDNTVRLWRLDGTLSKIIEGSGDSFKSVSFSADSKTLAAASDDNIKLWNRNGNLAIVLKARKDKFTSVSFSPTGRLLASGSNKGNLILQNLTSTKLDNLLSQSCYLLDDYLHSNPKVTKSDRALCPSK